MLLRLYPRNHAIAERACRAHTFLCAPPYGIAYYLILRIAAKKIERCVTFVFADGKITNIFGDFSRNIAYRAIRSPRCIKQYTRIIQNFGKSHFKPSLAVFMEAIKIRRIVPH